MCLSILVVFHFFIASIFAYACMTGVIGMYVHMNLHMCMSMRMRLDVYVFCIGYSHDHMPTDSAVDTHLNINLSTMMHIVATNYAGTQCIVPAINTHAILLI